MPTYKPDAGPTASSDDEGAQGVFAFAARDAAGCCQMKQAKALRCGHPFKSGDWVFVFRVAVFQRPLIEGLARVMLPLPREPDHYFVRFQGEARPRLRRVLPGLFQTDPDTMLAHLLAAWRPTIPPEMLAEFFPDDLNPVNDNEEFC